MDQHVVRPRAIRALAAHAVATAAFFAAMLFLSDLKVMSFDENFTYRIASLPSVPEIWRRMAAGVGDTNPPLVHILAHLCLNVGLPPEPAIRLPSTIGYWVMVVCVYHFAARRVPWPCALVGAALALCQYRYAAEGRAYGILLGFAGLSLVLWQSAGDGPRTAWRPAALGACLAVATFAHFYGFLLVLPFVLAEWARTRRQAKADPAVLAALAVGLSAVAALVPFARYSRTWSDTFWGQPDPASSLRAYGRLCGLPLTLILVEACLAFARPSGAKGVDAPPAGGFRPCEKILVGALILMPFWVHLVSLWTNAYTPRYAICIVPGIGLLGSWMLDEARRRSRNVCGVLAFLMLLALAYHADGQYREILYDRGRIRSLIATIDEALRSHPEGLCVVKDHHPYLIVQRLLDPQKDRRVRGLYDPARAGYTRTVLELSAISDIHLIDSNNISNPIDYDLDIMIVDGAREETPKVR